MDIDNDAEARVSAMILDDELPPDHRSGFVAVIGKPNVGKSTLINAWLGEKIAIVSPKPQTTRHRLRGILMRPDAQIIFVDTPGIHQPRHKLGEFMVETATKSIPDADVVLFMVDVSEMPTAEDEQIAQLIEKHGQSPAILVLNKTDLLPPQKVKSHSNAYFELVKHDEWMMISATRGDNRDELLDMVVARLPQGPRYYPADQLTDQNMRFIAAELIREQVLRFARQEVPHAVAVAVEEWKERRGNLTYILANIFVEKDSQKGILIGAGGEMLKRIGQAARKEIEPMVGNRVYLDLWVKVRKKWRKDEDELRRLGYALPRGTS
jgi:GTP-binding protein Era